MSTKDPTSNERIVSNLIKKNCTIHNVGVPSQHWQLKDMLKINNTSLIYSKSLDVHSYDFLTKKKNILVSDLKFFPTSLAVNKNYLLAGGGKGQIYMYNYLENIQYSGTISDSINNQVQIFGDNFYVSNNDRSLKIFSLDLMKNINIKYLTQVNYCGVSPDNKYLVIVGDTNDVQVYSIEKDSYRLIKKLKSMRDGGFCVSWNSTSTMFAVATQDGYVCIWDIRQEDKMNIIASKQVGTHKGAIRNAYFTVKNSLDLLVFTEQVSFLTVVDARTFDKKQIISVGDQVQLTGTTLSEDNLKIFVSTDSNIFEYDVNNISRRIFDE